MDFELRYTGEQEEFRKEVRAWLEANIPPNFVTPEDRDDITYDMYNLAREFRHKLGEKGWLAPMVPKEYGGGGLSVAQAIVVAEELAAREEDIPSFHGDTGVSMFVSAITVWGTEEQKRRFLPPMCRGEWVTWENFTEPSAGSDLASLKTRATRDGDEWVLNGEKIFVGAKYDVDYMFTLAVTDSSAPRHRNIGAFMHRADLPGISIITQDIFVSSASPGKRQVFYEDVRVPADSIIGGETDGWRVAQSALELEHGASGAVAQRNPLFEHLITYCKETQRHGQPLSKDPDVRESMVEVYMQNEISRLWALRNYWRRYARKRGVGYEGSQTSAHRKSNMPKIADAYLRIFGPIALIKEPKWAVLRGAVEFDQRASLCTHPGGTIGVQKIIMARRMGLSRTRETAAAIV